jgi:hypothetical protein
MLRVLVVEGREDSAALLAKLLHFCGEHPGIVPVSELCRRLND